VSNWHPLTWISHTLDWSLFGANASGHHLVSLLLHIGAVIFLFLFLNKTTNNIWPAAFAAAFFALHPLRCFLEWPLSMLMPFTLKALNYPNIFCV